jgi:hypothetical protein
MGRGHLGHLQRLACVSITGSVGTALAADQEVFLGLPRLQLAAEAETRASACRLCGRGRGPDIGHAWIHTQLMELDLVFDKMKPRTALGIPFNVEIPLCENWLSTWPKTLQSCRLMWYTDGSRMACRFGEGVCGVRPR